MNFEAQGGLGGEMPVAIEDPRTFDQLWVGLAVWMGQGLDFNLLNRRRRLRVGRRDARYVQVLAAGPTAIPDGPYRTAN